MRNACNANDRLFAAYSSVLRCLERRPTCHEKKPADETGVSTQAMSRLTHSQLGIG
jgi:hypothetical protein